METRTQVSVLRLCERLSQLADGQCLLIGEQAKGVRAKVEQLNMVGKRSGDGIVTHKATMVNVLSRGVADRLLLMDFTIGRKGLLNYIRSLAGSNIVKIVPDSNGSASGQRTDGKQRLKVVCGGFTSYLDDQAWIDEQTSHSVAEVRFMSDNAVTPNIGSNELADAIAKVLPFTSAEENRAVLQCILFEAVNGKLRLVGADGFRVAEYVVGYEAANGEAVRVLVNRASLKGVPSALRKAKRVKVWFGAAGDSFDGMAMYIDTDVARYKFMGDVGQFPNYEAVIPTECSCSVHLDTQETLKAVLSLKTTAENPKDYQVDLEIGDGLMTLVNTDERGQAVVKADSDGTAFIRVNGEYLASIMRIFGGMVDMSLAKSYEAMLFTSNGLRAVVMPMMSQKAQAQQRADKGESEAEAEAEPIEPDGAEAEPIEAELDGEQPEAELIEAELSAELSAELDGEQPEAELEAIEAEAEQVDAAIAEHEAKTQPKRSRSGSRQSKRSRNAVSVA